MSFKTLPKKILVLVLSLFLTLLAIPGIPILLLLIALPVLVIRFVVKTIWLFRVSGTKSGRILSPLSAFFAADRMYEEHPLSTNLISIVMEGIVDVSLFRTSLIENVLTKKDPSTGLLVYPELQQFVREWCGFYFWEEDKHFNVDNHIRLVTFPGMEGKPITESIFMPFFKDLLKLPYQRERSPWELIVIHNYRDKFDTSETPKTLLTYRLHHSLSGGYSTMNFIIDHAGQKTTRAMPEYPQIPMWKKIVWKILFIIRAPYELIYNTIDAVDINEWKLPAKKLCQEKSAAMSPPISIQSIKEIKNHHKTSFSAIISAAIAGGIREYMVDNGISVPNSIHVMTPWPVKNIPAKLGNFLTGVILEYPIGIPNSVKRMEEIHKNFIKMKFSTLPMTNFYMLKIMGRMFSFMIKPAHKNLMSTTIMSNIAGPNEEQIYLGFPVKDMSFVANFMCANVGLGFTVLSYNGSLRIVCGADKTILATEEKAEKLMEKILGELQKLKIDAIV